MIVVNLKGGLGNQMFQYATGMALARKKDTDFLLDVSGYSDSGIINSDTHLNNRFSLYLKDVGHILGSAMVYVKNIERFKNIVFSGNLGNTPTPRTFDLDYFNINAHYATTEQIKMSKYPYGPLSKIWRVVDKKILQNHYMDYHPELLDKISQKISDGKNVYLDGYFQSEKNFSEIRERLIEEFTIQPKFIDKKVQDFQKQIEDTNSIAIHIRRGDYANDPVTRNHHGLLPISYYRDAIEFIIKSQEHPHFYIFTDDPQWAKDNLKISGNNTYIAGTSLQYIQEFYLMTKCKNHIIANSSFSWWGAWLNQNPNKIVISPKNWTVKNIEHPNIIPEGWIRI